MKIWRGVTVQAQGTAHTNAPMQKHACILWLWEGHRGWSEMKEDTNDKKLGQKDTQFLDHGKNFEFFLKWAFIGKC